jgi:copper resistance protein B
MSGQMTLRVVLVATALLWSVEGHAQQAGEHHHHTPAPANALPDTSDSDESEREHVPPDPPASEMGEMTYTSMVRMMGMDDTAAVSKILLDQLEWRDPTKGNAFAWDVTGFYGTDYNKLWLRSEGERAGGQTEDARAELLWDRIISRWWSSQVGLREDFGPGPSRTWLAVGVQGMARYYFDVEATAYVGDSGRTAVRLKTEYEWLFTQRLILQPEMELNLYGKDDPENGVKSGLSDLEIGLRLRYEVKREFAPYVGFDWVRRLGKTAELMRTAGKDTSDMQAVAGVRIWF